MFGIEGGKASKGRPTVSTSPTGRVTAMTVVKMCVVIGRKLF